MTKSAKSKLPLILIMAGGLCFAMGWRMLGMVLVGIGGIMFATRGSGSVDPDES